jgi:hypothetical protein
MEMKPVTSSNIAEVGYDPQSLTLGVRFTNGSLYHYAGVTPEKHAEFVGAESIGKHFGAQIRGKYEHSRIEETEKSE